ncbi:hypothetical protein [Actinomadura sp. 9N407]|uniref:hypothetical protein n=1 Tax=Actinomadura sp. 9N407 TaxID=3375154 RepID=UPI0037AE250E
MVDVIGSDNSLPPRVRIEDAHLKQGCLAVLPRLLAFALLLVGAAAGAWWFEGRDKYADAGVPVSRPSAGHASPTPMVPEPKNGPGLEEIKYELQSDVVEVGGVSAPTTAQCEISEIPPQPRTFGCTVQYMGLRVPFRVDIADVTDASAIGLAAFNWDQRAEQLPVTRAGVYAEFWRDRTRAGDKDLRCDRIPERILVRPGRTNYFCYSTDERNKHHRYALDVRDTGLNFLTTVD